MTLMEYEPRVYPSKPWRVRMHLHCYSQIPQTDASNAKNLINDGVDYKPQNIKVASLQESKLFTESETIMQALRIFQH